MKPILLHKTRPTGQGPRAAFTLVELLVVIGILIILTVMTIGLVNTTQDEDRVRAGAAQVQSFLEGARDRAIHAKEPRGVRFLFDTQNPDLVTSMLYIGPPESFEEGDIRIAASDQRTIEFREQPPGSGTFPLKQQWIALYNRGLIPATGAVIRIFTSSSSPVFYTMNVVGGTDFQLTKDYPLTGTGMPKEYSLQLNPNVLPNQEPRQLPRDVVIDLDNSELPSSWEGSTPGTYNTLDVLFSPNGTVTGLVASSGVIHLVVAEGVDVLQNRGPGHFEKEGNERIVTLRTQTGGISVHNVDPTGATAANPQGATDPFQYAANGEPAR